MTEEETERRVRIEDRVFGYTVRFVEEIPKGAPVETGTVFCRTWAEARDLVDRAVREEGWVETWPETEPY